MKKYYNTIHFDISERKVLLRIIDVFVIIVSLILYREYSDYHYFNLGVDRFLWTIVLAIYIQFFGSIFEIYHLPNASFYNKIFKGVVLTTFFSGIAFLLTPLITPSLPSTRKEIIAFFLIIFISLWTWRFFYATVLASKRFEKKIIIVCKSKDIESYAKELLKLDLHTKVLGFLSIDGEVNNSNYQMFDIKGFETFLEKNYVNEIVVTPLDNETSSNYLNIFLNLLENKIPIVDYNDLLEELSHKVKIAKEDKNLLDYLPYRKKYKVLYNYFTRLLDLFFSIIGLLFLTLMLPFIIFFNLIGNRGTLFFKQERVGKNGKVFEILKLRTMIYNAEQDGAVFSKKNDSRITPFGKFLRRSRIDEIPQFWNVLKNEMALIGPRPERPIFVEQIVKEIPIYQARHIIKPGLTGWAQVNYPYGQNLEDSVKKLQYDLYYIKNRNVFVDFNIIIKTISTVLFMRGQ